MDIGALAQNGAQVIVTAMATELWSQLRTRLGGLFGRGDREREQDSLAELDEAHAALQQAASDHDARETQVELRALLRRRLREDPDLAAQFEALVEEVAAQLGGKAQAPGVHLNAKVDRGGISVQAGRDARTGAISSQRWPDRQ